MKPFTVKVCRNKGNARIWIEGKRLAACGFKRGDRIQVVINQQTEGVTIVANPEGDRKVSGRTRNGNELPIIDICSTELDFLKKYEKIEISFLWDQAIKVKPVPTEIEQAA